MAAGTLSAPGTEFGPCKESCQHTDWAETRRMASQKCGICGKEIGYETRFYQDPLKKGGLVHAVCLEKMQEKKEAPEGCKLCRWKDRCLKKWGASGMYKCKHFAEVPKVVMKTDPQKPNPTNQGEVEERLMGVSGFAQLVYNTTTQLLKEVSPKESVVTLELLKKWFGLTSTGCVAVAVGELKIQNLVWTYHKYGDPDTTIYVQTFEHATENFAPEKMRYYKN